MTDSTISIVAIGGSTRPDSSSERAVRLAARGAKKAGAHVTTVTGRELMLPIYDTETSDRTPQALALVEAIRGAHGLLVASPSYGGVSGMMKTRWTTSKILQRDPPYLHGRAVGCIAVAYGWQATVSTLQRLRQITHALRGCPHHAGCHHQRRRHPIRRRWLDRGCRRRRTAAHDRPTGGRIRDDALNTGYPE